MAEERQALGQLAELAAETAADADPVLRGDLEEVDPDLIAGAERLQQRATQASPAPLTNSRCMVRLLRPYDFFLSAPQLPSPAFFSPPQEPSLALRSAPQLPS